ncbi:MAG: hypothetical protein M4579_001922 [Chaenotheca gracillima]|nr:MAG: hypothetical protein M4579_001922 [Chaenotheca gracillima]
MLPTRRSKRIQARAPGASAGLNADQQTATTGSDANRPTNVVKKTTKRKLPAEAPELRSEPDQIQQSQEAVELLPGEDGQRGPKRLRLTLKPRAQKAGFSAVPRVSPRTPRTATPPPRVRPRGRRRELVATAGSPLIVANQPPRLTFRETGIRYTVEEESDDTNVYQYLSSLADIARLPDEWLAGAYVILNRYQRIQGEKSISDEYGPCLTAVAALRVATVQDNARRAFTPQYEDDILLPAWRLSRPTTGEDKLPKISAESSQFVLWSAEVKRAEAHLLQVINYHVHFDTAFKFLEPFLKRALLMYNKPHGVFYDNFTEKVIDQHRIIAPLETRIGTASRLKILELYEQNHLVDRFAPHVVAAGCIRIVMQEHMMPLGTTWRSWLKYVTRRIVSDFEFDRFLGSL